MAASQDQKPKALRDERICIAVTGDEKKAAKALAEAMGETEYSTLLRTMCLNDIVERAAAVRKAFEGAK